jgi:hypothetical protein
MNAEAKPNVTPSTLLKCGLAFEGHLPGMIAVEAARLVGEGTFEDLDELLLVAVGTYLDMRRHGDVVSLLQQRLVEEAIESGARPRPYAQGIADVLARLERPAPLAAAEALAAVA